MISFVPWVNRRKYIYWSFIREETTIVEQTTTLYLPTYMEGRIPYEIDFAFSHSQRKCNR